MTGPPRPGGRCAAPAPTTHYPAKLGIGHPIPDAGWHVTWVGGMERFLKKMRAFVHEEGSAANPDHCRRIGWLAPF